MIVDNFLSRLDKVKRTSRNSWIARCPSHADKSPSLTITEGDDGRVLMHCFAGCSVHEITTAAGVSISDLFPPKQIDDYVQPLKVPFNARDVMSAILQETLIVAVAASDLEKGISTSTEDKKRLKTAISRIQEAARMINANQ